MVSFTNHYNAISTEKHPSKIKIREDSWYFDKSFSCNLDFSSTTNNLLSLLKTPKITTLQQVT